jgi:hypothetical protein
MEDQELLEMAAKAAEYRIRRQRLKSVGLVRLDETGAAAIGGNP